jgi:Ni,Fe-hydrogenase III large subunit/Ni,Fe-hydrogenase III component G
MLFSNIGGNGLSELLEFFTMKPLVKEVDINGLSNAVKSWIDARPNANFGLLTSIDGKQLVTLLLDPNGRSAESWISDLHGDSYNTLTSLVPQSHWFERSVYDLFGVIPEQHPRLKHILLHDEYESTFHPLSWRDKSSDKNIVCKQQTSKELFSSEKLISTGAKREYKFLQVRGEGIYELPVGPIHAGVIEPGHFRFNCFGETILNLEIRLGYVHRGIEKRLIEVPWQKARFVAEAAASDTACANALAHAVAIESLFEIELPPLVRALRTVALEVERLAMHIIDVGGLCGDFGFLPGAAAAGRLRGKALRIGQMLSGSRFMRGFILPGGVRKFSHEHVSAMQKLIKDLRQELRPIYEIITENQTARERMEKIGIISASLAKEFGLVGVAARACGIAYDCRQHFPHGLYPEMAPPIALQKGGDILARTRVRMAEIQSSCNIIENILADLNDGPVSIKLPEKLPDNQVGLSIVEAFRGELIHMIFTDDKGAIKRYTIKDPSFNNWTAVSIAIRNNLIADFPLCNKSLSLSYSGNDL